MRTTTMNKNVRKRAYDFEIDVLEEFEHWCDRNGSMRGTMAQLGMWLVTHLDPATRQLALDAMNARLALQEEIRLIPAPPESQEAAIAQKRQAIRAAMEQTFAKSRKSPKG